VIEASKQCGRNRLMELTGAQTWGDFLSAASSDALRWIAHREAAEHEPKLPAATFGNRPPESGQENLFAIGPEGGFTDDEISVALDAGWQRLDLGPRILRVETAAIAVASWAAFCVAGSLS
jgi:16S rRNA (uracil1498-N3)-methyltransferase